MLAWTQEMIDFMTVSAKKTEYYSRMAEILAKRLSGVRTVCDAGCGIGTLAVELAKQFERVTAADKDHAAMEALRRTLLERKIGNVTCLEADLLAVTPAEKYDAMVFCYFGSTEQILSIAKRQCRGTVAIIKKNYRFHRFSLGRQPLSDETADDCASVLDGLRICFTREDHAFECGQPLRSVEEAMRFFTLYDRGSQALLTRENVENCLIRTDDPEYPFYLPKKKEVGILLLRAEELP